MNVALHARVSDPKEKRGTIESQIEALQAFARENGHAVVESYVCRDRYTGVELAHPELDRWRDGAEAGAFEAVLVYDPDRLSRKCCIVRGKGRFSGTRSPTAPPHPPPRHNAGSLSFLGHGVAHGRKHLRQAGLLHPQPERVRDPLFEQAPEFFDAEDHLQVRYELLRAHLLDRDAVSAICGRYGISRQTFYNLRDKFVGQGTGGLLPQQPGPKGPRKLTDQVLAFVSKRLVHEPAPSTLELREEIQQQFGSLCTGARSRSSRRISAQKKLRRVSLEALPSLNAATDRPRERYGRLRNLYLHGAVDPADPDAEHFSRRGLAGLFDSGRLQGYWVEVHEARLRGWGRVDPRDGALREAMRLLLTPGHQVDHSPSSIAERRIAL